MKTIDTNQPKANLVFFIHTIGATPGETIRNYISVRYKHWLEYSSFKCARQQMSEFAVELLDEVILNVLQKDDQYLMRLYQKKKIVKGQNLTELDFFILKAIDVNAYSPTAPFRHQNRPIPTNREVKVERIKIVEYEYIETDTPAELLKQTKLVRYVFNGLNLTVFERYTFESHFFLGDRFDEMDWHGEIKLKYSLYRDVVTVIHNILYYFDLTKHKPTKEMTNRQNELCTEFIRSHKISKSKSK